MEAKRNNLLSSRFRLLNCTTTTSPSRPAAASRIEFTARIRIKPRPLVAAAKCILPKPASNSSLTVNNNEVDVELIFDEWKKRYKLLSVEERCKFDEETLVNMNNIWTSCSSDEQSTKSSHENIVVTVLIAVKGFHKLPSINGTRYLKEALQNVASIPAEYTLAVEVFWTPQSGNDMQWEQKLLRDFPLLRAL